jgi:hypothetical protein
MRCFFGVLGREVGVLFSPSRDRRVLVLLLYDLANHTALSGFKRVNDMTFFLSMAFSFDMYGVFAAMSVEWRCSRRVGVVSRSPYFPLRLGNPMLYRPIQRRLRPRKSRPYFSSSLFNTLALVMFSRGRIFLVLLI